MPSSGLKNFVQAFQSGVASKRPTAPVPAFLAPAALRISRPPIRQSRGQPPQCQRQFASVNSPQVQNSNAVRHVDLGPYVQPDGVEEILRLRRQRSPEAWAELLDRYLPKSLRGRRTTPVLGPENEDLLPIEAVPSVLARARNLAKVDLLSYIGVHEERWEAVFWLVNEMLQGCPPFSILVQQSGRLPTALWPTQGRTLDDVSGRQIVVEEPVPSRVPLGDFVDQGPFGSDHTGVSRLRQILGQLWQGLGCMILQVEDRSANNPNREVILAHVLQILAHMHHVGALPDSIYNYDPAEDKTVLQRPPTLYFLSTRIMTALSDVAWKSHWVGEMEKAKAYGYDLPPPRIQPQLPRVGAEVWLDLVLWACVQGGWVTEAAWLIAEIERRRPNPSLQWSMISWDDICALRKPQLEWTALLKLQIDRARLNQSTGIGIASSGTSNVDMGARTISREVVLAIMDGLVNIADTDSGLNACSFIQVQDYLNTCKSMLERRQPDLDPGRLNTLILRSMESSTIDTKSKPGYLQRLLGLVPRVSRSRASPERSNSLLNSGMLDFSAAILGLFHRNLDNFARQKNLQGSLQAFRHIQDVIDANRDTYIQEFADELRERLRHDSDSVEMNDSRQRRGTPMLYPEIPPYVVEAFLDLIMETKTFDLGKWLLFNDDIDGGIMSPNLFAESNLQPALLRFATATADEDLLMRVLENLESPLSQTLLHALLRCQVALNKWDAVEGILKHFRDARGMAWSSIDAMGIAAAVIKMEWKGDGAHMGDLLQAKGILQDLVQGVYNSPRNQAQVPDLVQFQTANQLGRIFQSLPGALSSVDLGPEGYRGRAAYSIIIPSDAFNILLDTIVAYHGPSAGIHLLEQWCLDQSHSPPDEDRFVFASDDGRERAIQATPSMLRSILRSVIEDLDNALRVAAVQENEHPDVRDVVSRKSLSAFDWTVDMYRRFGFSNDDILGEVPAAPVFLRRFIKP